MTANQYVMYCPITVGLQSMFCTWCIQKHYYLHIVLLDHWNFYQVMQTCANWKYYYTIFVTILKVAQIPTSLFCYIHAKCPFKHCRHFFFHFNNTRKQHMTFFCYLSLNKTTKSNKSHNKMYKYKKRKEKLFLNCARLVWNRVVHSTLLAF